MELVWIMCYVNFNDYLNFLNGVLICIILLIGVLYFELFECFIRNKLILVYKLW